MSHDEFTKLSKLMQQGFDRRDIEFTKLFKYMQKEFAYIRQELDKKADKSQLDSVYKLLDAQIKKQETDEQERVFMGRQIDRHEGWIGQLAKKTQTKLVAEP